MQQLIWGLLGGFALAAGLFYGFFWRFRDVKQPKNQPEDAEAKDRTQELLRYQLVEKQTQIEALQAELLQASIRTDGFQQEAEKATAEAAELKKQLSQLTGRSELLEEQLAEANYQKRSMMIQLQDSDVLLEQLENLSHENRLLRERLDDITSVSELPNRLEEVLSNLSETKQVLESAMQEFGGLHTQIDINHEIHHLNAMLDRTREQANGQEVNGDMLKQLQSEKHELELKLGRLSRLVNEVWQKYRMAIKRLQEIADLESENHKLYLQLKVSNTKIAILRDRLAAAANRQDDLSLIKGITPAYKLQLRQAGIETFADLAVLTPDHIGRILRLDNGHAIKGAEWIAEARRLAGRSLHLHSWLSQQTGRSRRALHEHGEERPQLKNALERRLSEALNEL